MIKTPKYDSGRGFTIVELLIVIVVIGILAAIVIVAYSGVTARAKDTQRKADLNSISKAISVYSLDKNSGLESSQCGFPVASDGSTGGGGWYSDSFGVDGTISQCLINGKYLQKAIVDPSKRASCGGIGTDSGCYAYAVATCKVSGQWKTYIYARLEKPSASDSYIDGCSTGWGAAFDFNYTVQP